jgi:hypothetical protein
LAIEAQDIDDHIEIHTVSLQAHTSIIVQSLTICLVPYSQDQGR